MDNQKVTPDRVGRLVEPGYFYSRLQLAQMMGRKKTTHVINQIERAVEQGLIVKLVGTVYNQDCWCYAKPETRRELGL